MAWVNGWQRTSAEAWKRTRRAALDRDGWTCRTCGDTATEVDHIVNAAQGGSDDPANLAAICGPCHKQKTAAETAAARWAPNRRTQRPPERHPGLID